jgi:hypothetical protein
MGLWGSSNAYSDRPKFLPQDSNAEGAGGAREHVVAVSGGWGLAPGKKYSGNDNADAQPEVLVCIRNFAAQFGTATVQSIDWSDGAVADTGTFDIIVTFDEPVNITSAAWSANQTVTNKAYILLSRLGQTDMVEDSTMACMYYEGSGTNQLTFRGTAQTNAAAGYLALNGAGVGDDATAGEAGIVFNGSAVLADEDGETTLGFRQEGTSANQDLILLNGTSGAIAKTNGAVSESTTIVVDNVTGTIATGQVVTVSDTDTLSITDSVSDTGVSTDNTLTITAVASQTSFTVSEAVTIATNIDILLMADGGGSVESDSIDFTVAGDATDDVGGRNDILTVVRTGGDLESAFQLEGESADGENRLILDGTDGSSTNQFDQILQEDKTAGMLIYTEQGSTSGSANILFGVTVAAS